MCVDCMSHNEKEIMIKGKKNKYVQLTLEYDAVIINP